MADNDDIKSDSIIIKGNVFGAHNSQADQIAAYNLQNSTRNNSGLMNSSAGSGAGTISLADQEEKDKNNGNRLVTQLALLNAQLDALIQSRDAANEILQGLIKDKDEAGKALEDSNQRLENLGEQTAIVATQVGALKTQDNQETALIIESQADLNKKENLIAKVETFEARDIDLIAEAKLDLEQKTENYDQISSSLDEAQALNQTQQLDLAASGVITVALNGESGTHFVISETNADNEITYYTSNMDGEKIEITDSDSITHIQEQLNNDGLLLNDADDSTKQKISEYQKTQSNIDALNMQMQEAEIQKTDAELALVDAEQTLEVDHDLIANQGLINDLSEQMCDIQGTLFTLQKQNDVTKADLALKTEELNTLKQQLEGEQANNTELRARYDQLSIKVEAQEKVVNDFNNQIAETKNVINRAETALETYEQTHNIKAELKDGAVCEIPKEMSAQDIKNNLDEMNALLDELQIKETKFVNVADNTEQTSAAPISNTRSDLSNIGVSPSGNLIDTNNGQPTILPGFTTQRPVPSFAREIEGLEVGSKNILDRTAENTNLSNTFGAAATATPSTPLQPVPDLDPNSPANLMNNIRRMEMPEALINNTPGGMA